jgi:hypothetical protein
MIAMSFRVLALALLVGVPARAGITALEFAGITPFVAQFVIVTGSRAP